MNSAVLGEAHLMLNDLHSLVITDMRVRVVVRPVGSWHASQCVTETVAVNPKALSAMDMIITKNVQLNEYV